MIGQQAVQQVPGMRQEGLQQGQLPRAAMVLDQGLVVRVFPYPPHGIGKIESNTGYEHWRTYLVGGEKVTVLLAVSVGLSQDGWQGEVPPD
jgi:hypothetical protein